MTNYGIAYLERLARNWQNAYRTVNGKEPPDVVWERGWFLIGGKKYRRSVLEAMHTRLQKRVNAQ